VLMIPGYVEPSLIATDMLRASDSVCDPNHSHSIVPGGLLVTS